MTRKGVILYFAVVTIFLFTSCRTGGNPDEFKVFQKHNFSNKSYFLIQQKEDDIGLGNEILKAFLSNGFNAQFFNENQVLNAETVKKFAVDNNLDEQKDIFLIKYDFVKGFSSWSFSVIFKRLDIMVFNSSNQILVN